MLADPADPGEVKLIGFEGLTLLKSVLLFHVVDHCANRVGISMCMYRHEAMLTMSQIC